MFRGLIASLSLIVACTGDSTTDAATDLTGTTTVETADTAFVPVEEDLTGQFGSIVLGHRGPVPAGALGSKDGAATYYGFGLFASELAGFRDLPFCLFGGVGGCVTDYPAEGATEELTDLITALYYSPFGDATFRDAGNPVSAGGIDLPRQQQNTLVFYAAEPTGLPSSGELEFDGDLAPHMGATDIPQLDGLLAVSAPAPGAALTVGAGETIDFAWTAGGAGAMFLQTDTQLIGLPDTGTFELDVDSLGFESPIDVGTVFLSRISHATVDASGNEVYVQTRSDQPYVLNYRDTKGWTDLADGTTIANTCAAAKSLTPLVSGDYLGDLSTNTNDHDPLDYNAATGFAAEGADAVVRVDLTAGQTLRVKYRQPAFDASVYVMTAGCDATAATIGADNTYDGEFEEFLYESDKGGTYYVALDSFSYYGAVGGAFSLELDIID